MRISVSGASGLVGRALVNEAVRKGHEVIIMDRDSFQLPMEEFVRTKIDGAEAVINLAGAPVLKRWTDSWKEEIRNSRILTTRKIAGAISQAIVKPRVMISFSAIGIYDSVNTHTEESNSFSTGFLAEVCKEWEAEAGKAIPFTRLAILRCGVVISGNGGIVERLRGPFSYGLGATIGNGKQAFSFICIDDLIALILTILENETMSGIYNAVEPWPTTNDHFTHVLGKVLNQPAALRIPRFIFKMIYGESATILTEGQRVLPDRLMKENFPFTCITIEKALVKALR
ncbi:MAG TPA: TIGR01777 family oxidoreductase [Bacteroidales bacterium]|nr:TIGR01777 family oxidoreductase [Bacteroidales bacterium]HPS73705.1 TIGR01777 family oxidoreductase [Bacteroidales bacterium]